MTSEHRMYDNRLGKRHFALFHQRRLAEGIEQVNVNSIHEASMSRMDRLALAVTRRLGTFGTFLLIAGWTVLWLSWNILAPRALRFDPAPAFVFWLFISNMVQICIMPLIMVGQSLEARHSELLAESDYHVNQESFALLEEIKTMQGVLEAKLAVIEAKLPAKRTGGNGKLKGETDAS